MDPFSHVFPQQQVLFGRHSAAELRAPLASLGIERPLLVCSDRARSSAPVRSIVEAIGAKRVNVWGGVQPHAPLRSAIEGAQMARSQASDAIICIGGGSASDLAKGIALALAEGPDLEPFVLRRERGSTTGRTSLAPKVPIVALPTTLSGAEVTPGFSLTDAAAYKLIFRDPALAARLIVLDPELICGVPEQVLLGSGMNALAHCFEALYSKARTPISSLLAEDGLRRLWLGLQRRTEGEDSAEELLIGAYLAGAAIVNARTALHHAICHKLAPLAGISHGEANTAILPHALAFNLPQCPSETLRMASALGIGTNARTAAALIAAITARLHTLASRTGLRTRLREFDLDRSQLDELARRVFAEPGLAFNPSPIRTADQILEVLSAAW